MFWLISAYYYYYYYYYGFLKLVKDGGEKTRVDKSQ